MPEVAANELRGPGFALGLSYSALNTSDSGYGFGWNLQLSQYTPGDQMLSVSTGETFKVTDSGANGELLMRDKKLDSFHFYRVSERHYRLVHKSGLVEMLEVLDAQNRIALPTRILAASGHGITLEYRPFGAGHMILSDVRDSTGQTLLSVLRENNGAVIEFLAYPFSGPDGGPLARFVMELEGSSRQVKRIVLPTGNGASWRFTYGQFWEHLCITGVDTPLGGHEDILYQDAGHQFPVGSGRNPLPRVTRHLISPGLGQPTMDVRYSYPQNRNFLGFGLTIPWAEDGYDNLFKYMGEYDYTCLETLWVDEQPVRSIERVFNRFHLLKREVTLQNKHTRTVETTYAYRPGIPYAEQASDCQLPREVKTSWSMADDATRYRSESTSSRYDAQGNLIEQIRPDGIIERTQWYSAAGEDGCPQDPEGFVRYPKEKIVIPAAVNSGKAPTLITRYRYKALAALSDSELDEWMVPEQETLVAQAGSGEPEQELRQARFEYLDDPNNAFLHGRISRRSETLDGLTTYTTFEHERETSPEGFPTLQVRSILSTDFDDAGSVSISQQSMLTSREVFTQAQGVQVRFVYDSLGRLVRATTAPDTEFEASRHYEYVLCASSGEQAEQRQISARGVTTRTLLDGLGRRIHEERDHVDPVIPERFKQNYGARFNAWGVLEEETVHDWLDEGTRQLALTTRLEYDDWGRQRCAIGPDGVQSHTRLDPIGNAEHRGPIERNWRQSSAGTPKIVAMTESFLNLFGKPDRTFSLDADGNPLSSQRWVYDGLGRCVEHFDALDHATTFEYDAWSRLIRSRLPDQAIVEQEYAPHSSQALTTALRVSKDGENFFPAGRQQFDGLLRLTRQETGSRVEQYAYEAGHTQVKTRTTPAGSPIEYQYNLALTDLPVSSSAPDEYASFDYDSTSARLTVTANEQGSREYEYDPVNRLSAERWVSKGQSWETAYRHSAQGVLLERTEQAQGEGTGLRTSYAYDDHGRLERLDQGQLQGLFEYDELGRTYRTTTRDEAAGTSLVTELAFDDQGRETLRTLRFDGQPDRTVEQSWRADGLLLGRHLREGSLSLLEEHFDYDTRGRLTGHQCSGSTLPRDSLGREIVEQIFTFDALDNLSVVLTRFAGEEGDWERARYHYDGPDPFQLARIVYTPSRATPDPVFTYDFNGNQLQDERGQRLGYDSQNRLLSLHSPAGQSLCEYAYDGHDHLVTSRQGNASEVLRFYQDQLLTSSVQGDVATQFLHYQDRPLAQQQPADASSALLLLTDANGSVLGETQQQDLRTAVYSAYGERHAELSMLSQMGFNGEVRDPQSGWYLLGNGYRAYNPELMRFHSPDSLSPFGAGGINPYTYCLGNPIALRDPTGHAAIGYSGRPRRPDEGEVQALPGGGGNWMAWVGVAVGAVFTAIGVASLVVTFGASAPISVPLLTLSNASMTTGLILGTATALGGASTIASAVAAADDNNSVAGQVAFWTGIAGAVVGLGLFATSGAATAAGTAPAASRTGAGTAEDVFTSAHTAFYNKMGRIPRPKLASPPGRPATEALAQTADGLVPRTVVAAQIKPPAGAAGPAGITSAVLTKSKAALTPKGTSAVNSASISASNSASPKLDQLVEAVRLRGTGMSPSQILEEVKVIEQSPLLEGVAEMITQYNKGTRA
jgi:RHS repeat-associated protein